MAERVVFRAMNHREALAESRLQRGGVALWLVAVLCFGVGDVATTVLGLRLAGVVELHPVADGLFSHSMFGGMVALKVAAFGGCYALWRRVPAPHRVGVPLGLATLGVAVVAWNAHVLFLAVIG